MEIRYRRYKIQHKGKSYYIYIPQQLKDELWVIDIGNDWYNTTFLTGSFRAMKTLVASFALLGFNPYSIVFLPIGKDRIVDGWLVNPLNGRYDVVFRTNRVPFKAKDWKIIRNKLKKAKWTTYKMKVNEERIREYFGNQIKGIEAIPRGKILRKAGAHCLVALETVFFTYPRVVYQKETIDTIDWIKGPLSDEKRYLKWCYDEGHDSWTCDWTCFSGNRRQPKFTDSKPGTGLSLELYDLNIVNRYKKEKDYLVENIRVRAK